MEILLDWKSIGSLLATLMFIRTAIRDFLPPEANLVLQRFFKTILTYLQPKTISMSIEEYDDSYSNDLYDSVRTYVGSKCFFSAKDLKVTKPKNSKEFAFTMNTDQAFEDVFKGCRINWSFHVEKKSSDEYSGGSDDDKKYFKLTFHNDYKELIRSEYLPHVVKEAEVIKFKNRERNLFTNRSVDDNYRLWSSVPFNHPSTFDTIAISPDLKAEIKGDLEKFISRKDYYTRVGRAWKRGYLLYGPPGTGKTSLIASIANFLEFDIYDLELSSVSDNSQLRKLLISTTNKSVIVVEDIDCSVDLSDRKKKDMGTDDDELKLNLKKDKKGSYLSMGNSVSLSGVLNFIDGLWSSCGGERLIIFTTNHKEKLDAALLRPGRMDKHINLSFCDYYSFRILARNYLLVEEHETMKEVEELLRVVKVTPADVAEILMGCDEDIDVGMRNVVREMKKRLVVTGEKKNVVENFEDEDVIQDEKLENGEEIVELD